MNIVKLSNKIENFNKNETPPCWEASDERYYPS